MTEPRLPFEECWETVRGRAAGSNNQYSFLYAEIIKACERPGHFAEVGAYKGASGKMMAMLAPDKEVHIFETFEGFPAPTVFDSSSPKWAEGSFASDFDDTAQFLADCANIKLHVGVFPETSVHVHDHEFAFVHLDTDLFESTRDGIQFFARRLVPGGTILCHDYNNPDTPGVSKAVLRYSKLMGLSMKHIGELYALLQKPGGS